LVGELRAGKYDLALVLHAPAAVAFALVAAKIPVRVGPLSKWYSLLAYTCGIRQARSQVEMHEADYNLQLLRPLGIEVGSRTVAPRVAVSTEADREVSQWLDQSHVDLRERPWVAVHPGMGGSALNWPDSHYEELVSLLLEDGRGVIVTGGPTEQGVLEKYQRLFAERSSFRTFGGAQAADVQRLAALYGKMSLVIAPSTGPLHLAAAMQTPVVTFYPPIRVQSALRWGPYFAHEATTGDHRSSVFVPEVYCGQEFKCLGAPCASYPCMKSITVDQVVDAVRSKLGRRS
jgi:ADP-heptose:LPS heptosyltransferase